MSTYYNKESGGGQSSRRKAKRQARNMRLKRELTFGEIVAQMEDDTIYAVDQRYYSMLGPLKGKVWKMLLKDPPKVASNPIEHMQKLIWDRTRFSRLGSMLFIAPYGWCRVQETPFQMMGDDGEWVAADETATKDIQAVIDSIQKRREPVKETEPELSKEEAIKAWRGDTPPDGKSLNALMKEE